MRSSRPARINYYNRVLAAMGAAGKTSEWIRLFMLPGMGHCRGGDGPNTFDAVGTLDEWLEAGRAPDRIIATHRTAAGTPIARGRCVRIRSSRSTAVRTCIDEGGEFHL